MKRLIPLAFVFALTACAPGPLTMARPVTVDAGGFDCVAPALQSLGYTVMAGDHSLGFVRARRDRGGRNFLTGDKGYDVLHVNYIRGEAEAAAGEDEIHVTASLLVDRSPGALDVLALASSDHHFVILADGYDERGPTREGRADAQRLLDRCGSIFSST